MAKSTKSPIPVSVDDSGRPETDYEHNQRYLNDIDRATFQGHHAPSKGAKGIVHKMGLADHVPHIFKAQ